MISLIITFCGVALLSHSTRTAIEQATVVIDRSLVGNGSITPGEDSALCHIPTEQHDDEEGPRDPSKSDPKPEPHNFSPGLAQGSDHRVGPTPYGQPQVIRVAYNGGGFFQRLGQTIRNNPYTRSGLGIFA